MVEINYIKCQIVPIHPQVIKELPPEMLEELNDHTFVVKEGWRLMLCTRPPDENEVMETWMKLKGIKEHGT